VVTGFPGTGKSSVGRWLANAYGVRVLDVDAEVERRSGCTVSALFELDGERRFRELESDVFRTACESSIDVVVTGGGTLLSEENRACLVERHAIYCLRADLCHVQQRLGGANDRPLLKGDVERRIRGLYEARRATYEQWDQVEAGTRTVADVARDIANRAGLSRAGGIEIGSIRRSEVQVEAGIIRSVAARTLALSGTTGALVVTDSTVDKLGITELLVDDLRSVGLDAHQATVPQGEASKSLQSLETLYGHCLRHGFDRTMTVIGLGGGMITDLGAFLAATYMRGVRLVLVPSTLLAQVDAAIGGKAGVDVGGAKNMAGAFYPADQVLIDPTLLKTLPLKRIAEGAAEVVKIGLVRSASLFECIEKLEQVSEFRERTDLIREAVMLKLDVVNQDPREHGIRAVLNFGHTVGHGIEAALDFEMPHGYAVAIGMVAETRMAARLGLCDASVSERLESILMRFDLPVTMPDVAQDAVWQYMAYDKKRTSEHMRFALPTGIGRAEIVTLTPPDAESMLGLNA